MDARDVVDAVAVVDALAALGEGVMVVALLGMMTETEYCDATRKQVAHLPTPADRCGAHHGLWKAHYRAWQDAAPVRAKLRKDAEERERWRDRFCRFWHAIGAAISCQERAEADGPVYRLWHEIRNAAWAEFATYDQRARRQEAVSRSAPPSTATAPPAPPRLALVVRCRRCDGPVLDRHKLCPVCRADGQRRSRAYRRRTRPKGRRVPPYQVAAVDPVGIAREQRWSRRARDGVVRWLRRPAMRALRDEAFDQYGGPRCRECGESYLGNLHLHHPDEHGSRHRYVATPPSIRKQRRRGWTMYELQQLKLDGWPAGFLIVLCFACHAATHGASPDCVARQRRQQEARRDSSTAA